VIHKTAIISEASKIADNVEIGPYSIIGPNVKIENNTKIHSHVNIVGNTYIGSGNEIFPFASIGTDPQDLKYEGEENSIIIGNNNKIREYSNINPGTKGGGGITKIGNNNLIMVYTHIAHDCHVGNNIVLANNVQVGGHVRIEDNAIIGGSCAIHQFSRIGELSMVGGMTGVLSDIIPFGLSLGNRNNLVGLNLIGLRRAKISNEHIKILDQSFKEIFKSAIFRENIENLNEEIKKNIYVSKIINFIKIGTDEGATLSAGGPDLPNHLNKGYFIKPTIFSDVTNNMEIAKKEIFGPVLCIIPFETEEEAIKITNDTEYGLGNYIQTEDKEKAKRVAKQLRSGLVYINGNPLDSGTPYGGYKQSGNGREGGNWGLEEYLEVKTITGWK